MPSWIQLLITVLTTVMASGGFWTYIQSRTSKTNLKTKMILGLGYDRIVSLGLKYIDRGWITQDEYENLEKYIYTPYSELRPDDGTIRKIMQEVNRLPIRKS